MSIHRHMSKSSQRALQRSGAALYRIGLANTITIILFILEMKDMVLYDMQELH